MHATLVLSFLTCVFGLPSPETVQTVQGPPPSPLVCPSPSPSPPAIENRAERNEQAKARRGVQRNIAGASPVSDVMAHGYQIAFDGSTKDKKAVASATWTSLNDTETYEIKLSGPIDEGTEEVQPLSLDGLPAGFSAKATFQKFHWSKVGRSRARRDIACHLAGKQPPCEDADFLDEDNKPKTYDLTERHAKASDNEKRCICEIVIAAGARCNAAALKAVNLYTAYLALAGAHRNPVIWGFSGSVGRKKFDFLDSTTHADLRDHVVNGDGSFHVGRYTPTTGLLLFRGTLKRSWKASQANPDEICRPIPNTTSTRCKVVAIGPPTSETSLVATIEWRRFLDGGKVAVNPIASYDFKNEVTSFQLPIYFLPNDKGLTGGLRMGWRSDREENFSVSVFVGIAALSILP